MNYIKEQILDINDEALFLDGFNNNKDIFDAALIGVGERCGIYSVAVYNIDIILNILVNKCNMTSEEASEWYEYNILGSYVGDNTPIYVYDLRDI